MAKRIAGAVGPGPERLRKQGRISPDEVRPLVEQAAGGRRVEAGIRLVGTSN
ncbi:hypothetical protein [Streptomyces celluloflavus]|uniref:hypothetical protein n=1 Tax=Streptomyces celluloflavus TaxID=58344 RepID=UPI003460F06A|nr:hypothetical protein OG717_28985 [Streptomyces celluloflavus]